MTRKKTKQVDYLAMNVLPVIQRELRSEARHAFTYWLRVVGAAAALAVFAVMMIAAGWLCGNLRHRKFALAS